MARTFIVRDDRIRANLLAAVDEMRRQGNIPRVDLREYKEKRTIEQNAMLHGLCQQISATALWAGRKWDVEAWKRLLTAAWCRTRNEGVQVVPALDGKGLDVLYQRTSKLSVGEFADLITYILAWCAENDIRVPDPREQQS